MLSLQTHNLIKCINSFMGDFLQIVKTGSAHSDIMSGVPWVVRILSHFDMAQGTGPNGSVQLLRVPTT